MLRFTWFGAGGRSSNKDKGGGGIAIIILVLAIIFVVVSPIIATLMRLALSRQREYLADASAVQFTRNPEGIGGALKKIGGLKFVKIAADPEPLQNANKATASLYIENPLKEHTSFLNGLFNTHPPVQERIKILRAMG